MPRNRLQFTILELLTVTAVVAVLLSPCALPGPGGRAAMSWCFIAVTVFLVGGGTARIVSGSKRAWLIGSLSAVFWAYLDTLAFCLMAICLLTVIGFKGSPIPLLLPVTAVVAVLGGAMGGYLAGLLERQRIVEGPEAQRKPRPPGSRPPWWASTLPVSAGAAILLCASLCGGCFHWLARDEQLARFALPHNRAIAIFADPEFHYEPPGFLYFEVTEGPDVRVPRRRFQPIGPERKPSGVYEIAVTADGDVAAVLHREDVVILYEFSTGRVWPGDFGHMDQPDFETGTELLDRLNSEGRRLRCSKLEEYRRKTAR
jgi:hypothetical protein